MLKHTMKSSSKPCCSTRDSHSGEQEAYSSSSEESNSCCEDGGLARHVWEGYTNSQSPLNQIKGKVLEKVASPRPPLSPGELKSANSQVDVSEKAGAKGSSKSTKEDPILMKQTDDPELLGTKVSYVLAGLLLFVCFLLYLVLLILTIKAGSCADRLEELAHLAREERRQWLDTLDRIITE